MILANYTGKCSGCSEPIDEGEPIGIVDGVWVCESCVEDNDGEDGTS